MSRDKSDTNNPSRTGHYCRCPPFVVSQEAKQQLNISALKAFTKREIPAFSLKTAWRGNGEQACEDRVKHFSRVNCRRSRDHC